MKKTTFLILSAAFFISGIINAQIPSVLTEADFSTKTGVFEDARDGKTYSYKTYVRTDEMSTDWFMQNLNWSGAGITGPEAAGNADGLKYGRYYSKQELSGSVCPEGWEIPSRTDWSDLIKSVAADYGLADLRDPTGNMYTYYKAAHYFRGGTTGSEGIWKYGTKAAQADEIQFNILPSGWLNSTGDAFEAGNKNAGYSTLFYIRAGEAYWTGIENYSNDSHENIRHSSDASYASVRCVRKNRIFPSVEITTPYPVEINLKQIVSADLEKIRLAHSMFKYDEQPTGFYAYPRKKIVVNAEYTTQPEDNAQAKLIVGTRGFGVHGSMKRSEYTLVPGRNEFSTHEGGLIHLRFVTMNNKKIPAGEVKITFTDESEHVRAPKYVYGVTSEDEFGAMLGAYPAPEVLFMSDYAVACATRNEAIEYSYRENKKEWMEWIHFLLEVEDKISGISNEDPNPVHHRLKAGEVRHLLVSFVKNPVTNFNSPHATNGYTAYPSGSAGRYLTKSGLGGSGNPENVWMFAHEVGHQHQQPAYMIEGSGESTVNIYSYACQREIHRKRGETYARTNAAKWNEARSTYLNLPLERRIYGMSDEQIDAIIGRHLERNELRFMPWEQMFLLFGDEFYHRLHRIVREEKILGGTPDERRYYLIWTASRITGYDLRDFFDQWGIRVQADAELRTKMAEKFEEALAEGSIAAAPKTTEELMDVTGQNIPGWAPLPLLGIAEGEPDTGNLAQNKTVTVSTEQSGNWGIHIIDGNLSTRWAASDHTYPQWVEIDLENEYPIGSIDIHWYNSEGNPRAYQYTISVSSTGGEGSFSSVIDRTENTQQGLISDKFERGTRAQYIRIDIPSCTKAINAGMWELYVHKPDTEEAHVPQTVKEPKLFELIYSSGNSVKVSLKDNSAPHQIMLYNAAGTRIKSLTADEDLIISDLPSGIYILSVSKDGENLIQKFIVK